MTSSTLSVSVAAQSPPLAPGAHFCELSCSTCVQYSSQIADVADDVALGEDAEVVVVALARWLFDEIPVAWLEVSPSSEQPVSARTATVDKTRSTRFM
ncbi:hypothetical protein [Williamsia sp.]|uniref:hypothetical protein n=1 Tax=Williamsia sp. TaxID=1872085 RepID=UPI002F93B28C